MLILCCGETCAELPAHWSDGTIDNPNRFACPILTTGMCTSNNPGCSYYLPPTPPQPPLPPPPPSPPPSPPHPPPPPDFTIRQASPSSENKEGISSTLLLVIIIVPLLLVIAVISYAFYRFCMFPQRPATFTARPAARPHLQQVQKPSAVGTAPAEQTEMPEMSGVEKGEDATL